MPWKWTDVLKGKLLVTSIYFFNMNWGQQMQGQTYCDFVSFIHNQWWAWEAIIHKDHISFMAVG